jgi:methylenetetrahydrofolate--tRNA-(uracil-5-)-methyltransferase
VLDERLRVRSDPRIYLAGQLTGLEGYVECVATGLLAGLHAAAEIHGNPLPPFPPETAMGAMIRFCTAYEGKDYRPSNVNFGLFPPLADRKRKGRDRGASMADRAEAAFQTWLAGCGRPEYAFVRDQAEDSWTEADSARPDEG